jgi:hypothetical protein
MTRLPLYSAIEQACGDAQDKVPSVLHRKNNKPWLAIVPLDQLLRLAVLITETHDQASRHQREDANLP